MLKSLQEIRFDALAGYIRDPRTALVSEEIAWYSDAEERVLGVLLRDTIDNDFVWIVLGRDERRCFRAVDVDSSIPTAALARRDLLNALTAWSSKPDSAYFQDDAAKPIVDFFSPAVAETRFNETFKIIHQSKPIRPPEN